MAPLTEVLDSVVINRQLAETLGLPDPQGTQLITTDGRYTVVGVVEDTKNKGPGSAPRAEVFFFPDAWSRIEAAATFHVVLRNENNVDQSWARLSEILFQVEPSLILSPPEALSETVRNLIGSERLRAGLLRVEAGLALGLVLTVLLATAHDWTARHRKQIALRAALGATPIRLLMTALAADLYPILLGIVTGAGLSVYLAGWLAGIPSVSGWAIALAVATITLSLMWLRVFPVWAGVASDHTKFLR